MDVGVAGFERLASASAGNQRMDVGAWLGL
jgi:hypothetical protein